MSRLVHNLYGAPGKDEMADIDIERPTEILRVKDTIVIKEKGKLISQEIRGKFRMLSKEVDKVSK